MSKKGAFSFPAVGMISLLVIFAVLCLAVLAELALSTAQADARLSRQTREAVLGYYRAELEANRTLAQLRQAGERGDFTFRCPISDTQALEVEARLEGDGYQILRWQTVSTLDWQTDEKLPVWDGQG